MHERKRPLSHFTAGMGTILLLVLLAQRASMSVSASTTMQREKSVLSVSTPVVIWGPWAKLRPGLKVSGSPNPADSQLEHTYVRYATIEPHTMCVAYATRESLSDSWNFEIKMGFEPEWSEADYDAAFASCENDPPQK